MIWEIVERGIDHDVIRQKGKKRPSTTRVFGADRRLADVHSFIAEALSGKHDKDGAAVERMTCKVRIQVTVLPEKIGVPVVGFLT